MDDNVEEADLHFHPLVFDTIKKKFADSLL